MADSGSDLCCGFYLGRIDHYLLYDADTENPAEKMDMFSVFIGWILLQLYHTFGIWRTAGTDLLYEKRKDSSEFVKLLKNKLMDLNINLGSKFPNVNFKAKDIDDLVKVELSFNHEVRMKYSFMSFILASKI